MPADYKEPYLVFGAGRCGTSTVARILHEQLGICMGDAFIPADKDNPLGYFEDKEFVRLNHQLLVLGFDVRAWMRAVTDLVIARQNKGMPWGIKNIRMAEILGLFLCLFDNPKLIYCIRRKEDTIASFMRCHSFSYTHYDATTTYWYRTRRIERLLQGRDCLSLDFTNHVTDEYIIKAIKEKWNDS